MNDNWKEHFKYYDIFQNNFSSYLNTVQFHLSYTKNKNSILDSGAGTGNLTLEILKLGKEVTAIDSSPRGLEILKEKCQNHSEKLTIKEMNVEELDFENETFDHTISMFVIPFVKDNKNYFSEVYRTLKPNGLFTISAWAPLKDSLTMLTKAIEKDLITRNILPKYQKEWDFIFKTDEKYYNEVLKGPDNEELKKLLLDSGFSEVEEIKDNPYGQLAYFFVCKK